MQPIAVGDLRVKVETGGDPPAGRAVFMELPAVRAQSAVLWTRGAFEAVLCAAGLLDSWVSDPEAGLKCVIVFQMPDFANPEDLTSPEGT
jgi:hypothetical protein